MLKVAADGVQLVEDGSTEKGSGTFGAVIDAGKQVTSLHCTLRIQHTAHKALLLGCLPTPTRCDMDQCPHGSVLVGA